MQTLLIKIGLALSPFVILSGMNSRLPKEALCLSLAMAVGLISIYQGILKPFRNKWFLSLIGFCLLTIFLAPKLTNFMYAYFSTPIDFSFFKRGTYNTWMFQPLSYILIYSIFIISVASIRFKEKALKAFFNIICLVAGVTSVYIFLQYFNLDQFFKITSEVNNKDINFVTTPKLGAFFGNSTLVSAFLVMTVPFLIHCKRWIMLASTVGAILLTQSIIAIVVLFIIAGGYIITSKLRGLIFITIVLGICTFMVTKDITIDANKLSNGRFDTWKIILKDFQSLQITPERKYPLTGLGMGSYSYLIPNKHESDFFEAHNELLEILYNIGIIGLVMFLLSIGDMFMNIIKNKYTVTLLVSFIASFLCALGTLNWQVPTTLFYTCFVVGLLHNQHLGDEDYAD